MHAGADLPTGQDGHAVGTRGHPQMGAGVRACGAQGARPSDGLDQLGRYRPAGEIALRHEGGSHRLRRTARLRLHGPGTQGPQGAPEELCRQLPLGPRRLSAAGRAREAAQSAGNSSPATGSFTGKITPKIKAGFTVKD